MKIYKDQIISGFTNAPFTNLQFMVAVVYEPILTKIFLLVVCVRPAGRSMGRPILNVRNNPQNLHISWRFAGFLAKLRCPLLPIIVLIDVTIESTSL